MHTSSRQLHLLSDRLRLRACRLDGQLITARVDCLEFDARPLVEAQLLAQLVDVLFDGALCNARASVWPVRMSANASSNRTHVTSCSDRQAATYEKPVGLVVSTANFMTSPDGAGLINTSTPLLCFATA